VQSEHSSEDALRLDQFRDWRALDEASSVQLDASSVREFLVAHRLALARLVMREVETKLATLIKCARKQRTT
jgi:hypothetical protein